jgi:hypothetical protein
MWDSDVSGSRARSFDSSAIARAAYDPEAATLDLWYRGGDRYRYFGVPETIYEALIEASSTGEYVNREIKPRFRYEIEGRRRFRPE